MLRNKRLGRAVEARAKKALEADGYVVIKTAVSDSNPDIIAFKNGTVYFVEVKRVESFNGNIPRLAEQLKKLSKLASDVKKSGIDAKVAVFVSIKIDGRYVDVFVQTEDYDEIIEFVKTVIDSCG